MSRGPWLSVTVVVLALLVSGCVGNAPAPKGSQDAKVGAGRNGSSIQGGSGLPTNQFGDRVQIYDKDGVTPLDLPAVPAPISVAVSTITRAGSKDGVNCGEPTGGVGQKKAYIFQVCLSNVFRSSDHGATWEQVSTQVSSPTTLDPYLWVDPRTDRVYSVQLYVGCSYLAYSDNYGGSGQPTDWVVNPAACGVPVNDHQTLAGGPSALATPMAAYPDMLYYCVNQIADTMCSRSFDGGVTFSGGPAEVTARDTETGSQCSAINGHVTVGKDGTVYVPKRECNRPVVMVSTNNGITWEEKVISRAHGVVQSLAHDPTITTDADGVAYFFWTADDGVLRMTYSKDKGQTWAPAVRVSPPGLQFSLFETSVGGDPGRVAVAYYGTYQPRDSPDPKMRWKYSSEAPNETVWNLFLTTVTNALDDNPTFTTVQVNPSDDPIQRGCVWLQGGSSTCRNLLDFFDTSMGPDGRVYIHYADGCVNKCVTWQPGSKDPIPRSAWGSMAVEQSGPSLKKDVGWVEPLPMGTKI